MIVSLVENDTASCECVCVHVQVCVVICMYQNASLVPKPLPDFISQLRRKIGCKIKSGSDLGTRQKLWNKATKMLFYCVSFPLCKVHESAMYRKLAHA